MTARKRGGLGDDPLDAFLPQQQRRADREQTEPAVTESEVDAVQAPPAPSPAAPASPSGRKRSLTVTLPPDLVEELRDAVVYLEQQGERVVLAGLVETALTTELRRLRRGHDVGQRFPTRGGTNLRTGPRIA